MGIPGGPQAQPMLPQMAPHQMPPHQALRAPLPQMPPSANGPPDIRGMLKSSSLPALTTAGSLFSGDHSNHSSPSKLPRLKSPRTNGRGHSAERVLQVGRGPRSLNVNPNGTYYKPTEDPAMRQTTGQLRNS